MSLTQIFVLIFIGYELVCMSWMFSLIWDQQWEKCGTPMGAGIGGVFVLLGVLLVYG